jgi:hypothetical protein
MHMASEGLQTLGTGDRAVTNRSSRRDAGASPGCDGGDGRVVAG